MPSKGFKKIKLSQWQQLGEVEIDFHPRLTILTGANGSGKTTILNLMARHSGWNSQPIATPKKNKISSLWEWVTGRLLNADNDQDIIGKIEYLDGGETTLMIPKQGSASSAQYEIQIRNQQEIPCFFIPSHRPVFRYEPLGDIPTKQVFDKRQAFDRVSQSNRNRYFGGNEKPGSFYMKQSLVSWNVFGHGNEDLDPNEKWLGYYRDFQDVLKIVLPASLGFNKFVVRNFEIVLECDSGDFTIDAASGGISAIIDMAWQIFMYSSDEDDGFTVLIDEIENHLHPTMQRKVLPDFVKAFPKVSFIVSTHSPLIVGSEKESTIYALRYNKDHKIISQKLDLKNEAKTASEILDEVLGVSFTMPIWVEERLKQIVDKFDSQAVVTAESLQSIRSELSEIGLEKLIPEATMRALNKHA